MRSRGLSLADSGWSFLKRRRVMLLSFTIIYLMIVLAVFAFQRQLQYFPSHEDVAHKGHGSFEPLESSDGAFLGYIREGENAKKVLLFFHGNGGEALHRNWVGQLDPDGWLHLVLAEYPGYGGKPGKPSEVAIFQSALEIYDEVARRYGLPISVMGESLGTGVASYVASQRPVKTLLLAAPFTSACDVAAKVYWFIPVRFLMSDRFDSIKHLAKVTVPLRIVHGSEDQLIPISHARELLAAYPGGDKQLFEIPNYGHNDLYEAILLSPIAADFRETIAGERVE